MIPEFLKPLVYFDIFNHPLTKVELEQLCIHGTINEDELNDALRNEICFRHKEYISLSRNVEQLVNVRKEKEHRAKHYLDKLSKYSKLISKFPFVKGIAVSGSLSKNVMHDDGDIDYFIITTENRLWVCRTLLILFKKVFLLNSKKYFCVNYFVDEKNFEIKDKNVFTAVELTYLLPVYNPLIFEEFLKTNSWTELEFRRIEHPIKFKVLKERKSTMIEWILKGKVGEWLDIVFMNMTIKRWKNKFKSFDREKMELTMRSNRGISKHHPSDFQTNVLKVYHEKLDNIKLKHEGFIYA